MYKMSDDLTFAISGGGGIIGRQAAYCARSIRLFHPSAQMFIGVPESEDPPNLLKESPGEILRLDIPIKEYPISTKAAILSAIEPNVDLPIVVLDSDTILVDPVTVEVEGSDLLLKPSDLKDHYWGNLGKSQKSDILSKFGYEIPENAVQSTVSEQKMTPYYNAGVVVSNNPKLGEKWSSLMKEVHDLISVPRFADQVSLSMLASTVEVEILSEDYNYPLYLRVSDRPGTNIIHYRRIHQLMKCRNSKTTLSEVGILNDSEYDIGYGAIIDLVKSTSYGLIKSKWVKNVR